MIVEEQNKQTFYGKKGIMEVKLQLITHNDDSKLLVNLTNFESFERFNLEINNEFIQQRNSNFIRVIPSAARLYEILTKGFPLLDITESGIILIELKMTVMEETVREIYQLETKKLTIEPLQQITLKVESFRRSLIAMVEQNGKQIEELQERLQQKRAQASNRRENTAYIILLLALLLGLAISFWSVNELQAQIIIHKAETNQLYLNVRQMQLIQHNTSSKQSKLQYKLNDQLQNAKRFIFQQFHHKMNGQANQIGTRIINFQIQVEKNLSQITSSHRDEISKIKEILIKNTFKIDTIVNKSLINEKKLNKTSKIVEEVEKTRTQITLYKQHPQSTHQDSYQTQQQYNSIIIKRIGQTEKWRNYILNYTLMPGNVYSFKVKQIKTSHRNLMLGVGTIHAFGAETSSTVLPCKYLITLKILSDLYLFQFKLFLQKRLSQSRSNISQHIRIMKPQRYKQQKCEPLRTNRL